MPLSESHRRLLVAGIATLASFAAYAATVGAGAFWQDAGLFLGGMKLGGGLAPPGYPIYLLLGRPFVALVEWLLPGHPFPLAVHLFSAVWGALAAGVTSLTVMSVCAPGYRFFSKEEPRPDKGPGWPALAAGGIAGLLLGLSYSLWSQAINAEAYAMNGFFTAWVLNAAVRLGGAGALGTQPTARQRRLLLELAIAHGLSCANHPVTVVFLPALGWLVYTQRQVLARPRLVLGVFLAWTVSALLPYLYLPVFAALHPASLYPYVTSLEGFIRHVTGSQWTAAEESYGWSLDRLREFPLQLWQEFFAVGLLAFASGLLWMWRSRRPLLAWMSIFAAVAFAIPIFYLQGGEYDLWLITLYAGVAVVCGAGLNRFFARISRKTPPALAALSVLAVGVGALAPPLAVNVPLNDRRDYFVPDDFARNLYRHVKQGGILFTSSDQECSLAYYLQAVEGHRPDVATIIAPFAALPWYPAYLRALYPDLNVPEGSPSWTNDDWIVALALANVNRPSYISKRPSTALPAPLEWVPSGALWKLDAQAPIEIDRADWEYEYRNHNPFDLPARRHAPLKTTDPITGAKGIERTRYTEQIKRFHMQGWNNLGNWLAARGDWAGASAAYAKVLELDPGLQRADVFFSLGKALFAQDRDEEAARWLQRAVSLAPRLAEAHLYLGQIAHRRGDAARAEAAFRRVRESDPSLWKANEGSLREAGLLPAAEPSAK